MYLEFGVEFKDVIILLVKLTVTLKWMAEYQILSSAYNFYSTRLSTEVYIHVKEEITIEECHLSQYENLRRLEADDHQTLDLKHKGTLSAIRNLRENVTYTVTEIHIRRKNISSVRFQMDSFTKVKEEITIDEHDLTTYDTLELDADNDSTCNVETRNTVMQSNPCSKPNRDSLHLKEHLFTHPGERSHACERYRVMRWFIPTNALLNAIFANSVLKEIILEYAYKCTHEEQPVSLCQVETLPLSIEVSIQKKLCTSARVVIKGSYTQQVDIPTRLQNEWYIPIKEEITIDEHDLLEVQNLEIKADERRTLNTKDQKTSKNVLCCKICSQPCGGLLELNEHLLTHPQERTHGCDNHKIVHSDQRPFECDICKQTFKAKRYLQGHRNTHTNEKQSELQNEWYIPIKEEITIDEHDLLEVQNLEIKADERRTLNTKDQKTSKNVLCCKICSQPCGGLLELNEHLLTHPQERTHGCDVLQIDSFTAVKEEITIDEHDLFECDTQELEADNHDTGNVETQSTLQIDSFTTVKEEITITEHNLFEYDTLGLEADNHSTGNVETQNTLMQSNPCSKLNRDLLHLNEHLSTHPGERPHACELMIFERISRFIQTTALLNAIFANSVLKENQLGGSIQMHTRRTTSLIIPKGVFKGLSLKRRIKEEITIDDHDPLEVQNVDIKADERQTLNTKDQKTSKNALCYYKLLHSLKLQNEADIQVKDEITVDEDDLPKYGKIKSEADNISMTNGLCCDICSTSYKDVLQLNDHLLTHSRPHACDICNLRFIWKSNLAQHLKKHTKQNKFQNEWYISIKEEITIDEHDPLEALNLEIKADERPTFNTKDQKTSKNALCCKICSKPCGDLLDVQNDWHVKEEITIDEHDLSMHESLKLEADDAPTSNGLCCNVCSTRCSDVLQLNEHLLTHIQKLTYACDICNLRFKFQNEWCIQMKEEITIDEHDPFEVQHFEMKADERRSFNTEDQKTSQNALYCKICTQPCGGLLELNEHLRTHALERPHACDICNLRFKWKSNLAQHRNKHTREKRLACEICQQEFLYSTSLNLEKLIPIMFNHVNIRTEWQPHQDIRARTELGAVEHYTHKQEIVAYVRCKSLQNGWCIKVKEEVTIDEQDLSKLESIKLKADKTSTTNEFCCNVCSTQCSDLQQLNEHLLTHIQKSPYLCDICNLRFKLQNKRYIKAKDEITIDEHYLSEQGSIKLEPDAESETNRLCCNICSKTCDDVLQLNEHLLIHLQKLPYACDICHLRFKWKSYLEQHRNKHTKEKRWTVGSYPEVKQEIEINEFDVPEYVKLDFKADDMSKTNGLCCNICNKSFIDVLQLNEHLLTHTEDRPYACDICNLRFKWRGSLAQHRNTHTKQRQIDEHDLTEYEQLDFKPDNTSMNLTSLQLNEHLLTHAEDRPHTCDVSHRRLRNEARIEPKEEVTIDEHDLTEYEHLELKADNTCRLTSLQLNEQLLTRAEERPHACDFCNLRFRLKMSLKIGPKSGNEAYIEVKEEITIDEHNLTEYEQLDLRPDDTSMSLTSLQLNEHLLTHAEERPHACDVCHQKFKEKNSRISRSFKLQNQSFIQVKEEITIEEHDVSQYQNLYFKTDSRISRTFKLRYQLKTKIKEKISTDATDVFESEQVKLKAATKSKANGLCCKICCKPCRDLLLLNEHLLTHSQERPFECDLCKLKFRRKLELQLHRKKHAKETRLIIYKWIRNRLQTNNSPKLHNDIKEEISIEENDILQMVKLEKDAKHENAETKQLKCKMCSKTFDDPERAHEAYTMGHPMFQTANSAKLYCNIKEEITIEDHDILQMVKLEKDAEDELVETNQLNGKIHSQTFVPVSTLKYHLIAHSNQQQLKIHQNSHTKANQYECQIQVLYDGIKQEVTIEEHDVPDLVKLESKPFEMFELEPMEKQQADIGRSYNLEIKDELDIDEFDIPDFVNIKEIGDIGEDMGRKSNNDNDFASTLSADTYPSQYIISEENTKNFECIVCHKLYKSQTTLRRHQNIHTKAKEYNCKICKKTFYYKTCLSRHVLIHSSEQPLKCDLCNSKFDLESSLREHLIRHANSKQPQNN
ncbi:hypothetical protein HUJ04_003589 [Dendroctonus ponderosae]|nr:hypothetical protein HUJ04_003589 [Dendroctonus ponderosae]